MKRRRAARAMLNTTEKREGGSGENYRAGYQAGYALGLRLGQEDRGSVFDGTSIIIPAHPHHDSAVQVIQHVETMTPHLYEVLVADAGATPATRRYIHGRSGAIRHVKGKSGDNLAVVINRAISTSLGEYIAVLAYDAPNLDNWLGVLIRELEREPAIRMVYASSGGLTTTQEAAQQVPLSGQKLSCLLFRRKLPKEIGLWMEDIGSAEDSMLKWLERIPVEQRSRIEASTVFAGGKL
ncbi:glycosyltransferase [Paenibacillus glucanolyticus]|uniref:glycosyltransferase n=1 Tax=Paenibacillus glucanolyticus TaxID=59843 RepID=UPI00096F892D|nr:glycosyltransferase [Paenibacillus glucanolyticus]OMF72165.1 hypothetical protein BK142_20645 [Paenibacillus glucanolyticus]